METALTIIDSFDNSSVVATLNKITDLQMIVKATLKQGHDYDVIPGTNKPTLLKPGAEKIGMLFGLNPEYEFLDKIEDYKSEFFAYNIRCTLYRNGNPVAQGVGSCNSKEKKYKYINVSEEDIAPHLDKTNLDKTTDRYGRVKYKIENPDICSLVNTILKMSKKRAYIDAILQVAALSEIFTQDIEDMKEFVQQEHTENMTLEEASTLKINFGKHKGKTLGEVYKAFPDWIDWFVNKADKKDPVILKAIGILQEAAKQHVESKQKNNNIPSNVDLSTGEILDDFSADLNPDDADLPWNQTA